MFRRAMLSLAMGMSLAIGAFAADVVVRIGPPRAVAEHRVRAPGPGYVWVQGYQSWNGRSHVWVPGRWELAPRPHARWVPHRWVRRNGGWVLVEGRWR